MSFRTHFIAGFLACAALLAGGCAVAAPVEVHGSTTVNAIFVTPSKAEIEKAAGAALAIKPSNSGAGLMDIANGTADVAMISEPFAEIAGRLAALKGLTLEAADYQVRELGQAHVEFVVNPANPVKALTKAQLADILTGTVSNWKEVGGADMPITVITEQPMGAMRTEIVAKVMGGKDFPDSAAVVSYAPEAAHQTQLYKGALAYISSATPPELRGKVAILKTDANVLQTMAIVTKANPNPETQKVANAIEKVANSPLKH